MSIKEIKARDKDKPLSVIAPDEKWIKKNLIIDVILAKYLPGPYTIILKKKNKNFLSHVSPTNTLGVRMPNSEFCKKIQKSGVPFITTSVNLRGKSPAKTINEIPRKITEKADIIIDKGKLNGRPSTLIRGGEIIKR